MEALLYDVHGNLPALEAVLADAEGATRYILGGDYALFGGWPTETVERLQQLAGRALDPRQRRALDARPRRRGRRTRSPPGAIESAREALGERLVEDLAALPTQRPQGRAR